MTRSREYQSHDPTVPLVSTTEGHAPLWLIALHAGSTQVRALSPGARIAVGRLESNEVCIADRSVSRTHAEIVPGTDTIRVRDLGSHNGVRVRNRLLAPDEWAELHPGESFQIGAATLLIQSGPRPAIAESTGTAQSSSAGDQAKRTPPDLVVNSEAMRSLLEMVQVIGPSDISVLILGETGVGKERIAEAVHRASTRAARPFLRLNCAAIAPTLLESELFGHEKGAFTGATSAKPGLLETASGGTVFLDEIGEMPVTLQAKLLRVLEDRTLMRVGGLSPRRIDVRFVAATHRELRAAVSEGTFRQDLYFRLNGITLSIPPLRERRDEVEALALHFASESPLLRGMQGSVFAPDALARLVAYDWPGNIRELRNAVERAVVLAGGRTVTPSHLPPEVVASSVPVRSVAPGSSQQAGGSDVRGEIASLEKQRIVDALAECNGNQSRAAERIGMPRRTFLARLEQYGIPRPRKGTKDP